MPRAKVTPHQIARIARQQGRRCQACGSRRSVELDHVVPVAAGGSDHPSNLQWLCFKHNQKKGTRVIDYRAGWRSWVPVRLYRRLDHVEGTRMLKPALGLVVRLLAALASILAAIMFAPVVVPAQHTARTFVLDTMIGVWSIARTVAIVGVGSVVLALFWHMLRGDKQVYPDEYGQLPIPWRVLRKHPELALRTIQHHQETRIIAAKNPMPTHFNYSPKFAPAAEAPMLEQAAPAPEPVHKWVPQVVEHPAHLALLGDTGSGKSTLARVIEHARAATDKIVILDPHANLNNWCGLPTVGAGRNFAAIGAMIHMIHAEFQRRYDLPPGADLGEPLTVFIDEVPAIADEDKDLMPIIAKWLREGRKVGIRLCMLSQGGEVKTLGIEGQGSIRENFLFVRMGTFARNTAGIAPGEPYPAALVRGYRSDDPPVPLDTAGLTSLPLEVLPASVAWAPSVALLSGITTIPGLDSGAKAPENNSNTTSERVLELIDAGKSLRAVQIEVFGYAGGAAHDRLQAILKKAGRLPIPR